MAFVLVWLIKCACLVKYIVSNNMIDKILGVGNQYFYGHLGAENFVLELNYVLVPAVFLAVLCLCCLRLVLAKNTCVLFF